MRRNKRRNKGIASIEFALGFVGFWLMCMLWVEMSYMSFVSAVTDITISEAARQSKKARTITIKFSKAQLIEPVRFGEM